MDEVDKSEEILNFGFWILNWGRKKGKVDSVDEEMVDGSGRSGQEEERMRDEF